MNDSNLTISGDAVIPNYFLQLNKEKLMWIVREVLSAREASRFGVPPIGKFFGVLRFAIMFTSMLVGDFVVFLSSRKFRLKRSLS